MFVNYNCLQYLRSHSNPHPLIHPSIHPSRQTDTNADRQRERDNHTDTKACSMGRSQIESVKKSCSEMPNQQMVSSMSDSKSISPTNLALCDNFALCTKRS